MIKRIKSKRKIPSPIPTLPLSSISPTTPESLDALLRLIDHIPYESRHSYSFVPQLSQEFKSCLATIDLEYHATELKIKALGASEDDVLELKRIWFETFFDFLFNKANEISPRLFVYFQQHALLKPNLSSWTDILTSREIDLIHDKFFELIGKIDSPGRIEAFYKAPKALILNAQETKECRRAFSETALSAKPYNESKVPHRNSI